MNDEHRDRTEQKLRYALVHLHELAAMPIPGHGHDFERAHHEAILFQLIGAYDAFLGELNALLRCGCPPTAISPGKLRKSLQAAGRTSAVLRRLHDMRQDPACWLHQLHDLRHVSAHERGIPLAFYLSGKVAFQHPHTREEFPMAVTDTLATWHERMTALFRELRSAAESEGSGQPGV
jgi:Family of unknown function (DUF6586)